MKQGRAASIVFTAISVILIIVCVILFLQADRRPPEFTYQASDVSYREGMDPLELLLGVTAYDHVDGDVTERIVIEKIIENRENSSVVVFYAVSDHSGNAAKSSRVFDAVFYDMEKGEGGRFPEAGIDAEMNLSGEGLLSEEGNLSEDGSASEGEERQDNAPAPTETPIRTPEPEPPMPEPEPAVRPVPTADPAAPVLTLKVSEVRVKAGQGPAWVNLIGTLSDDKDSYETLFHNLSVSKYDRDKAGAYGVSVHTEDSDGNRSSSVPLTIIVE